MHAEGTVDANHNTEWIINRLNPAGADAPPITLCLIVVPLHGHFRVRALSAHLLNEQVRPIYYSTSK